MAKLRAVIFDAYGTLLDVDAAMRSHAAELGAKWPQLSQEWRLKQLEYSWVRSLAGAACHRDFLTLTREALNHVALKHGIGDATLIDALMAAYRAAAAYPEVVATLERLRAAEMGRAILSNGEPGMLGEAVRTAGIGNLLDAVLSVEAVGVFKPDPRVYRLAAAQYGCATDELAFVSSNAWDAFGAHVNGFRVFWVNRRAQPDEYELRNVATELRDLADLPTRLR
jgi:2-haloacid dehalogenase